MNKASTIITATIIVYESATITDKNTNVSRVLRLLLPRTLFVDSTTNLNSDHVGTWFYTFPEYNDFGQEKEEMRSEKHKTVL